MSRFGAREGSFCELTAGMGIFKYAMKESKEGAARDSDAEQTQLQSS